MIRTPFLLFLLSGAAVAAPLTPEAMIGAPRTQDCVLSPDGRTLAVQRGLVDWDKNKVNSEVLLFDVPSGRRLARLAGAGSLHWAPDSKRMLFLRSGSVCVSDLTGKAFQVTAKEVDADNAIWSPDGKHIAYVAETPQAAKRKDTGRLYDDLFLRRWSHYYSGRRLHLFLTDLQGHARDVTPGEWDAAPTSGTWSNGDNFVFSPEGDALFCSAPPAHSQAVDTNYDVWKIDLKSLKRENWTEDNPAADLGPQIANGKLYVLSYARPGYESDFGHLRARPLSGEGNWTRVTSDLGSWTVSERGLLFTKNESGVTKAYFQEWGSSERTLLNPEHSLHRVTLGSNGTWAAVAGSLNQPPRAVTGKLGTSERREWADPVHFDTGEVGSLEVPVEGGSMQMWFIKPPDYQPGKRYPLAFLIHGGPQGGWGDDWSLRWNPQVWAAQGYLVAMPNPTGSSGRGHAYQELVSRDWGGRPYRDLLAGLEVLRQRPDVDSTRLCAAGASYGGYMVNWIAVHPNPFQALVTHDGVWNLDSMYGTTDELWFPNWEFGAPPYGPNRPTDYDRFSPHRYAENLKTPHLVVHNDLDYRCPVDQGLQLFTALQLHGVPSKFLNFPDEGHWVLKPANSLRWHQEVFRFLRQYCSPGPATS